MRRTSLRLAALVLPALLAAVPWTSCAADADVSAPLVLVAGATGRTGKEVVKQLQAGNYRVRALVRDEAAARAQLGEGIEYVKGDMREAATLQGVADGAKFVVSAVGSNSRKDPTNTPELVDYGGVKNLVDVAKAAGVKQFVLMSSMGVTQPDHMLNKMLNNVLQWKLKGEDYLRASGVPYTIVRPGGLTEAPGGAQEIVAEQGDKPMDPKAPPLMIPRADVATVIVRALGNPAALGKTLEISGKAGTAPADWNAFFAALKKDAP